MDDHTEDHHVGTDTGDGEEHDAPHHRHG
jgi:hypothetical protein